MENQNLDRLSYALGLSMGNNFMSSGIKELKYDDFAAGVQAVFEHQQPKMSYEEAKTVIREFFTKMEEAQQQAAAVQGKINAEAGEKFLVENAKRPEIKTTPSGLQYEVVREGEGPQPGPQDKVKVHYTGKLIDGTVFDSSVERGEPATFGVSQVIPGWVEALQMMKAGSRWIIYVPSNLAYGPQGAGPIGPNSTLIFDVDLMEVHKEA